MELWRQNLCKSALDKVATVLLHIAGAPYLLRAVYKIVRSVNLLHLN